MARAFLAGAAILAGASASAVGAQDREEEVAFARPLPSAAGASGGAVLPQPLSPSDASRVRRIFRLQAEGDTQAAESETGRLDDTLLNGHIVADRLLRNEGSRTVQSLSDFLSRYGDLPDAAAVREALVAALPPGAPVPAALPAAVASAPDTASLPSEQADPLDRAMLRNPALDRTVRERARAGRPDAALRLLAQTRGLSPLYNAQLRAEIAQILFTQGQDTQAVALAEAAHRLAGGRLGLPPFIAGLAAWRLERLDLAGPLFEAASHAVLAPASLRAGAAFWTARVHLRLRDPAAYVPWMQRAARERRTFYGMLASRALGHGTPIRPSPASEIMGEADAATVAGTAQGRRALALLQVGQTDRARAELRVLWTAVRLQPAMARSIILVAKEAGLADLADQFALAAGPVDGSAKLPLPRLRPTGGFRMEPALVYALTRLESNFDSGAVSPAGARGLMQIMPGTANYITRDKGGDGAQRLHDPATNLDLGQRYLLHLSGLELVGGDLIRLLASYNAGPGSFGRWSGSIRHGGDPLLFIESIPNDETRAYVSQALAWSWIYAGQLRQPSPSLDELAAGTWPRFQARPARTDPFLTELTDAGQPRQVH